MLSGAGPWTALDVVPATGSTNADLAARARAGDAQPGSVLTTDDQRAGRGRRDRAWTTPPRSSVAVSVLVRPDAVPRSAWSWLPLLAGLSVVDAVVRVAGLPAGLKWPNDVLVDGRKLCGVLAEVVELPSGTGAVLGIGLNATQSRAELPVPTATSLALEGAAVTDRDTVLRAVLRALGHRYTAWVDARGDLRVSGLGTAYRESCRTIGQQVRVELPGGDQLVGDAEGVDDVGRLVVRAPDGRTHALAAGDVIHVRPADGPGTA